MLLERAELVGPRREPVDGADLAYDQNNLVFEYALLSYFRESDIRYSTQLVGFDEQPSEWATDFKKEYTSLPQGSYVFRVWGRDAAGNVAGPVERAFRILPAPWHTWWAYALYTIAAGGLLYMFVLYRVRTLHNRADELEGKVRERTAELADTVEELRRSEQRANEANRAKSVFLSNMSHELRTPLNAVIGFAQLMDRSRFLGPEDRNNLEIIQRSGEHLLSLINDVLSIAKIEAGRITLSEQPFDVLRMLQSVQEMIRVRAESKGLDLTFDIASSLPAMVRGDEGKLRQVLINLLGNAVKFTDEGRVTLRARWEAGGRASFEIEDTGYGISPEDLEKLFQPFQQTESGLKAQEGTGLGLVISRTIVRLMGGEIRVSSRVGHGSTFTFDVDLPATEEQSHKSQRRRVMGLDAAERRRNMLVVDDIRENRMLLANLLRSVGFDVREAVNGKEAVEIWSAWRPRLIWMDMRMPVMNGVEATKRIRTLKAEQGDESRTVIIALTASVFEHERDALIETGCDDFVTKPFREETIFDKLEKHLNLRFVYEDVSEVSASSGRVIRLAPERFSSLDGELFTRLYEALLIGDVGGATAVIASIRVADERLASDLEAAIADYRIETITEAMDAARPLRVS